MPIDHPGPKNFLVTDQGFAERIEACDIEIGSDLDRFIRHSHRGE